MSAIRSTLGLICLFVFYFSFSACEKTEKEIVTEIKIVRDTIRIVDTLDVDRPINFRATKGFFGTKINVSWSPMPLAQKYQVFKFIESTQKYVLIKELSDTTFDDSAIAKALTKNFYKVRTYNNDKSYSRFSDADFGYTSGLNYYRFLSFGTEGSGASQFNFAMHITNDANSNIYVSDEGANRVLKFNSSGTFLEQFYTGSGARALAFFSNGNYVATRTQSSSYVQIFNANKQLLKEWGTYGSGDSNFGNIEELAIDDEQHLWIVDGINDRVKKYDQNGNLLLKFGKEGTAAGDFDAPFGICYFKSKIYVSDTRNSRIQVFDKSGKYLRTFANRNSYYAIKAKGEHLYIAAGTYIIKTDENGDVQEKIGEGQFQLAVGVTIGPNEEVIACDVYGRKIVIFKRANSAQLNFK